MFHHPVIVERKTSARDRQMLKAKNELLSSGDTYVQLRRVSHVYLQAALRAQPMLVSPYLDPRLSHTLNLHSALLRRLKSQSLRNAHPRFRVLGISPNGVHAAMILDSLGPKPLRLELWIRVEGQKPWIYKTDLGF